MCSPQNRPFARPSQCLAMLMLMWKSWDDTHPQPYLNTSIYLKVPSGRRSGFLGDASMSHKSIESLGGAVGLNLKVMCVIITFDEQVAQTIITVSSSGSIYGGPSLLDLLIHLHLVWLRLLPVKHLPGDLFPEGVNPPTHKGLDEPVNARYQPEDSIDEVHPDGALLNGGAAPLVRVIIVPVEEDASKDAKHDDPQQEQRQVPREQARGLEPVGDGAERRGDGEGDGGDAREPRDDEAKDPLGREGRALGTVLLVDAVAVEPDDDEAQDELQAADHPARDVLPGLERGRGRLLAVADAGVCTPLGVRPGVEAVLEECVFVLEQNGQELCDGHYDCVRGGESDMLARS